MKSVELVVRNDLFEGIGVTIGQLHHHINKDHDFMLCGSVSTDKNEIDGFMLDLRVNLCNEKGEILFVNRSYSEVSFDKVKYDAFSISCSDISRFLDINELHHIEIYPHVRKVEKEE